MMTALIIEDELPAQAKLEAMLKNIDNSMVVLAKLSSVKDAVTWLRENPPPDLAFVDIQLSDDHSFEIFRQVNIQFPVIFTTAYDRFILESFEYNSIDYLLKPFTEEKLKRSLIKLKQLERHFIYGNLEKLMQQSRAAKVEDRIVVRKGTEFIALDLSEVAYFFSEHRIVFVKDFQGRQFIADKNLGELESTLDPKHFYRLNRKYIANIKSIEKFRPDNGKIRVFLKTELKEEIHVSKESAPGFRSWIGAEG